MTNNTTTAPTARYPSGWYYSQEQQRSGTTSIASSTTAPLLLTGAVLTNATITSDHSNSCIQNTTASSLPSITTACGLCARPVVLQNPHAYTNLQTGFSCASCQVVCCEQCAGICNASVDMMEPPPPTPPLLSDSDSLSGSSPTTPNRFCTPEPLDFSVLRARLNSAVAATTMGMTNTNTNGNSTTTQANQASRLNLSTAGSRSPMHTLAADGHATAAPVHTTTALGLELDSLTIRPVLAFHQDQDPHRSSSVFPSVVAGAAATTGSRPSSSSSSGSTNQGLYDPQQQQQQQQLLQQQAQQQCSGTVAVILAQPKSRKRKCRSPLAPSISLVQTVPDMPVGYASAGDGRHYHPTHHQHTSTTVNHLPTHHHHPGHLDGGASLFHPAQNAYRSGAWDRQAPAQSALQQPVSVLPPGCTSLSATAGINGNSAVANNHVATARCPSAAVVMVAPNFDHPDHHQQNGCSAKCCLNCLIRTTDGHTICIDCLEESFAY